MTRGRTSSGYHPRIFAMHQTMALRERIKEDQLKQIARRHLRNAYWWQRAIVALDLLREADPDGWETWYDDNENVPDFGPTRDRSMIVEAHARQLGATDRPLVRLYKDVFIWADSVEAFVFMKREFEKEPTSRLFFTDRSEAIAFVDGLDWKNRDSGYVLGPIPGTVAVAEEAQAGKGEVIV